MAHKAAAPQPLIQRLKPGADLSPDLGSLSLVAARHAVRSPQRFRLPGMEFPSVPSHANEIRKRSLLAIFLILGPATFAQACSECGGKVPWAEVMPTAAQLYPDARVVDYTLDIAEAVVAPAGEPVRALTINGTTPGPTLRFREGDVARITVVNRLEREMTSIHWHGLLVPNPEDGVPHLTTPAIEPGRSRTFEFLLKQSGTYWYHSHTGLQEQRGVHGSIVIEPRAGTPTRADLPRIDRDEVVFLTDWTNENPAEVLRTLVRGSEWYAIRKGTAQSLWGAWRAGHLAEYLDREKARLPAMDISDVAYDAFLMNGHAHQTLPARPNETVRLRVINASSSTYFYLSSAIGPVTIVAADGVDVAPIQRRRLLIGMAETYDVIITLPADGGVTWEVRATAQDNSGHTSLYLGEGMPRAAPAPGRLEVYSMDAALGAVLDEMDESGDVTDAEALAVESERPLSPYKRLRALASTSLPAEAPRREETLRLTGDMWRYQWSINGRTIDEQSTVPVRKGEVLRLVLVNDTMMHHPMHLHGHFFRLLMPDGAPAE
jgi:FtsP/CotA-like multicopper oxidase with cupredoxin domain